MQSEKMKAPLAEREWIEVEGKKLHWERFINMLDNGRMKIRDGAYCDVICPLQDAIEKYVYGANEITEYIIEDAEDSGLKVPSDISLPSVMYDFYHQIASKYDLSAVLEKAAKRSEEDFVRISEERVTEQNRKEAVRKMAEGIPCETVQEKIAWILSIQAQKNFADESQKSRETIAAELWCSLLIHSLNAEYYITHGQMLSLVEDDILTDTDISHLLNAYGDNRDYEWYSEDLIGTSLSENTDLKIADILEMAEPIFKQILGL